MVNVFYTWRGGGGGGELHKNISQILATINLLSGEIARKTLSVRKNFIGNIHLSQTSCLNLDKFSSGNEIPIPDCRSRVSTVATNCTPTCPGPILRVI